MRDFAQRDEYPARPAFAELMRRCECCGEWFEEPFAYLGPGERHCPACDYDIRQEAHAPRRRGHVLAL